MLTYRIRLVNPAERTVLQQRLSEVILSERNSTVFIDEPERHLHRSISSPLLNHLQDIRKDIRWVIATHDLSLLRNSSNFYVLTLIEYNQSGQWKHQLLTPEQDIPDVVLEAIYGARERAIFVEGTQLSRDLPIYKKVFRGVTIIPVGSCTDVANAVKGTQSAEALNYINARGIVDGDNKASISEKTKCTIHPLPVYAIESIYYHSSVFSIMLEDCAERISRDDLISAAIRGIGDPDHLARINAYRRYKELHEKTALSESLFDTELPEDNRVDGKKVLEEEIFKIQGLIKERNWDGIVGSFKIKSTKSPNAIAKLLGFASSASYERSVVFKIDKSDKLLSAVRRLIPDPFSLV